MPYIFIFIHKRERECYLKSSTFFYYSRKDLIMEKEEIYSLLFFIHSVPLLFTEYIKPIYVL